MGFDGSSITGFNPIEESDMIAMPDPSTFTILPWRPDEQPTARMFCDIQVPGGEPYEGDPRWILQRALQAGRGHGLRRPSTSAPSSSSSTSRTLEPADGVPEVLDEGGYFDLTTLDAGSDVRRETVLALEQMGIHVEYTHHEVGPSQHEVDMRYKDALAMADDCMTYRITVKEYAMKYGWHATFMPKPLNGENGSGMHVHQSLSRDGGNAFYDADDQFFLSQTAKAFIAGQLKHAREISPLFAQWVNSYKRLVPGYEAPIYLAWSRRNRSALIRVPLYHPGQGGGDAGRAALPRSGLQSRTSASRRCCRPASRASRRATSCPSRWSRTSTTWRPRIAHRRGIEQLPENLGEAIELAAESELVLRTLGEHTFNRFIEIKRAEWEDYRVQVTPWEVGQFLPIL